MSLKIEDPDWRRERARAAGKASQALDAYITRIVNRAPELTDDQRARLRALLRPEAGA